MEQVEEETMDEENMEDKGGIGMGDYIDALYGVNEASRVNDEDGGGAGVP